MDLNAEARSLSEQMRGGNVDRMLRARFLEFRTTLYRRGIYDPLLGRFDSHTVNPSSAAEVAAQLEAMAGSLR